MTLRNCEWFSEPQTPIIRMQQVTMLKSVAYLFSLLLLLCCQSAESKISIQHRNGTQFELPAVEIIFITSSMQQRITDPVILTPTTNEDDVNGKICIHIDGFANDVAVSNLQSKGALAVVVISYPWSSGFLRFRWTNRDAVRSIQIPVYEIMRDDSEDLWSLVDQNDIANITLMPSDEPNSWDLVLTNPGYYFYMAFLMTFETTNIALAIWKIKTFVDFYGGFKISFAMAVLCLEIVSNLIQIFSNIDIFGAHGIYNETASWVLYHLSFPFTLAAIMLFSLYWHEIMTSSSIIVHPFIVKMRIPFFIVCGLLLLMELTLILVGIYSVGAFTTLATYIYLPVTASLVVFYLLTGWKLLLRLKGSKKKGRKVDNLKQATVRIMISMCFLFAMLVIGAVFTTTYGYTTLPYVLLWCSLYLAIDCSSLMNILAFGVPSKNSTSNSGGSSVGRNRSNTNLGGGSAALSTTGSVHVASSESGKTESV